nr:cupin domain-containing protein [Maliibacterium massiliense]
MGASTGLHTHSASSESSYVVQGVGTVMCDQARETLQPGAYHDCPKGAEHSIVHDGDADLVLFTVVTAY